MTPSDSRIYSGAGLKDTSWRPRPIPSLPWRISLKTSPTGSAEVAALTQPERIYWCDGSAEEYQRLREELVRKGELRELNQDSFPGCYLYRSDPTDVARVEHLTFVCTSTQEEAGPNNNWLAPAVARARMRELFRGCMRGRTLYVVPYCMGPIDSPNARCGVEITDSAYVVLNMWLMTRMGRAGARAHRGRWHLRARTALDRRSESGTPLHHALPRGARDRELRLRATAATRCWARSATRCASPATRPGPRAGWPSTC